MDHRVKSREDWEKELVDVQHGVTFTDGLRRAQIISEKFSASPAPIPDSAHLFRGLVSGVLLAVAVVILSSDVPYKVWLGGAALMAGCCLGATAFRWERKRR
jgi:hypothetical protein